ncbi:MAG: DUF4274 domain-containing protein [Bacteroidales bacterium]|nr:DUF4274 domain-containing protein [Bacteroidales bacterium]
MKISSSIQDHQSINGSLPSCNEAGQQRDDKPQTAAGACPPSDNNEEDESELFDARLTELFVDYFSRASAFRTHEVLLSWNFDNPKKILEYVVSQAGTDIATAQMIYWRMEPESVRDCEEEEDTIILDIIEQNIGQGYYADNGLEYDPRDDEGRNAIEDNTEHTPEDTYHPELLKSRTGIHLEGIMDDDGIPAELYSEYAGLIRSFGLEDAYLS